ncbi:MAG: hypothetical protein D6793_07640, partial [Thermoflexia bacterium]
MTFAKAGVVAGEGPAGSADLDAVQQAGLEMVKLRWPVNPVGDVAAYRSIGVHRFLVQLLSPDVGVSPVSPETFVEAVSPAVEAFLRAGVTDFEVHGEPNLAERGYGVSWDSPAAFA